MHVKIKMLEIDKELLKDVVKLLNFAQDSHFWLFSFLCFES